jgi:hypothetical protein
MPYGAVAKGAHRTTTKTAQWKPSPGRLARKRAILRDFDDMERSLKRNRANLKRLSANLARQRKAAKSRKRAAGAARKKKSVPRKKKQAKKRY